VISTGQRKPALKKILSILGLLIGLVALIASISFYLGYVNYYRYQEEKKSIKSLESDFESLEARLEQAVRFYPLPVFYSELGWLRLQRAMGEIEFGLPERSGQFLDSSREALKEAISKNPVDHSFFWELSKVYFLYNYPLLTYAEKGRLLCQEAVRRHPYNDFLLINVAIVFVEQWPLLESSEKDWLRDSLQRLIAVDSGFIKRLKNKWRQNYKETRSLELKLAELGLESLD